jgi:signal transduction histidine kinase
VESSPADRAPGLLYALASLASRAEGPARALDGILALIAPTFSADSGSIALLNPESAKLEVEASFGMPVSDDLSLLPGQGLPGWSALHSKPVLAPDVAADQRYRAPRPGIRCQMAAPMIAGDGHVIGVITLDRDEAGAYNASDLRLLAQLADEAGCAMQRLWQLEHLQGKARQLETLLTTGQALVSKLEQQELFDTLTRDTRHMLQARACALYLYDGASATVRLRSFTSSSVAPPALGALPLDSCLLATAIRMQHSVAFTDIQTAGFQEFPDLPPDPMLRSVLVTPMPYEVEILGALVVFTDRVHRFDNDEKRLCSALASLGAVALRNVELYSRVFQSEETLRKNERLTTLGLLAAEIAHEIRNPLTVLKLLHGGLGLDFPEDDPRRTDMRVIGEKLDQLEAIVTRVLSFAKAPSSLHTRWPLAEIIEDTLVLMRLKLAQGKIQVQFEAPARPLVVDGHKGQLQQVLLNLLINSMQAMPEGGRITIALGSEARDHATMAVLEIADTGAGIPDEFGDRIFDSFLSGRSEGTGLGLAIAKRILLGHHGDIELVSTGSTGTTFRVTLPLAKN